MRLRGGAACVRFVLVRRWLPGIALALVVPMVAGCERPFLANDGTLVFQEHGAHGAAVMTANGLEFHDRDDVPPRIVHRDANEPWRAPIGFIVPADGRFVKTSAPTVVATTGLGIALRPSDTRVPSWGGEVLVRIDVIAPAAEGTARMGEQIAIVLDGDGEDLTALADAALDELAARDRVSVVDAAGARVVVPPIPGSHRDLASAAIAKRASRGLAGRGARDLGAALRVADRQVAGSGTARVLVLSDGRDPAALSPSLGAEIEEMAGRGVRVSAVAAGAAVDRNAIAAIGMAGAGIVAAEGARAERAAAVRAAIPAAGELEFRDVTLTFAGIPAPSHVIEASGGQAVWRLDAGELALGDVHAGEARTDVVRVSVPAWVPGERFAFTVTTRWKDARDGVEREMTATLPCKYDDDIERIAKSRHGDVIAYASALATLRRLDAAFVGEGVARAGGLRAVAQLHARSMKMLGERTRDPAIMEQAEVLQALLGATP